MSLLKQLLALHRVDVQVRSLRARLEQADRYLAGQQRQLDDLLAQRSDLEGQKRQLQAQAAAMEVESRSIDDRVQRLRGDLNQSANTKQYNAVLQEMKTIEAQKDQIDEQALAVLDRVEQAAKRIEAMAPLLAERTRLRDAATTECAQRRQDTGDRLGELERERATAAAQVPAEAMALFDEVADLHEGEAMSEVEVIDARHREYACTACNTEIPLAIYARLAGESGKVVQCVSCKRILHMPASAEAEAARAKR
jgi:predicted  nucleic acid-binding Zn-ribbon protein